MLNNTICFLSTFTMELAVLLAFKLLTNHKEKIYWKYITLTILFSGICTLEYKYNLDTLNTITSMMSYFILYYLVFRKSIKETIYYGTAIFIIGTLIDIFTMFRSGILEVIEWNIDLVIIRGIDTFIMEILLIGISSIKKVQDCAQALYKKIKKSKIPYLRFLLIMTFLLSLSLTFFYIIRNNIMTDIPMSLYLLIVSSVAFVALYINREYNFYSLKETNENIIKSNEFYLDVVTDYRILKHNIIAQLNGVKSVANKESRKLIDDLIEQYNNSTHNVQDIKKMPVGINGLVYEKIYTFNNKEVRIGIDNKIESKVFDNLTPRTYNLLCEALGILLDNALQATEKAKEKILMIDMREDEASYQIKIINTFEEFLEIEKLGTLKYSTKTTGHGLGLFSLIGKNKLKLKTSVINDLFLSEIIIDKK